MASTPPMPPPARTIHCLAMAMGAVLAAWGLAESARLAGVEPDHLTTRRGATSAALLLVAAAFSFTGFPKWSTWRAIPFFLWSYILAGLTVDHQTQLIVKAFAPGEPTTMDYAMAYGKIAGALVMALLLAVNALRAARAQGSGDSVGSLDDGVDPYLG